MILACIDPEFHSGLCLIAAATDMSHLGIKRHKNLSTRLCIDVYVPSLGVTADVISGISVDFCLFSPSRHN